MVLGGYVDLFFWWNDDVGESLILNLWLVIEVIVGVWVCGKFKLKKIDLWKCCGMNMG